MDVVDIGGAAVAAMPLVDPVLGGQISSSEIDHWLG